MLVNWLQEVQKKIGRSVAMDSLRALAVHETAARRKNGMGEGSDAENKQPEPQPHGDQNGKGVHARNEEQSKPDTVRVPYKKVVAFPCGKIACGTGSGPQGT